MAWSDSADTSASHVANSLLRDPAVVSTREDDEETVPASVSDLWCRDLLTAVAVNGSLLVLETVWVARGVSTSSIAKWAAADGHERRQASDR